MANLITITQVGLIMPIAENFDDERGDQFIALAQNTDLKQALNDGCSKDFLQFIIDNQSETRIALLLNGGTYEFNNETFGFVGLNAALALYSYARIVKGTGITITGNNIAQQTNDWSLNADTTDVKTQADDARGAAAVYVKDVIVLLCRLSSEYPEYGGTQSVGSRFNMTVVDKNKHHHVDDNLRNRRYGRYRYF